MPVAVAPDPLAIAVHLGIPDAAVLHDAARGRRQVSGDKADLPVTAQVLVQRLEPWGEIVEATRYPVKGTVSLSRSSRGWRPSGSDLERVVE